MPIKQPFLLLHIRSRLEHKQRGFHCHRLRECSDLVFPCLSAAQQTLLVPSRVPGENFQIAAERCSTLDVTVNSVQVSPRRMRNRGRRRQLGFRRGGHATHAVASDFLDVCAAPGTVDPDLVFVSFDPVTSLGLRWPFHGLNRLGAGPYPPMSCTLLKDGEKPTLPKNTNNILR